MCFSQVRHDQKAHLVGRFRTVGSLAALALAAAAASYVAPDLSERAALLAPWVSSVRRQRPRLAFSLLSRASGHPHRQHHSECSSSPGRLYHGWPRPPVHVPRPDRSGAEVGAAAPVDVLHGRRGV